MNSINKINDTINNNNNNISTFIKDFKEIVIEFGTIVYPLILFFFCLFSYGPINLYFISKTYKDPDMINAIGISNLYVNISTEIIITAISGALETLASNAYGVKNYKLMGIYFDRCRYVSISYSRYRISFGVSFSPIYLNPVSYIGTLSGHVVP